MARDSGGLLKVSRWRLVDFAFLWADGSFCANAEELTVLGEATVGGVEEQIGFVEARDGQDRAEAFQLGLEGLWVG